MVFNSNGKSHVYIFKYKDFILETVKSYCYLGVTITYSGHIGGSSKLLMEKGRKAFFKIKNSSGLNNPCRLLEKLFDTLVVPVVLYGSEIWGLETSLNDSEPFEYMHMKFIKEILGVHYKATNVACRAEIGRLPLKSKVQTAVINFCEHIIKSQNSLVNKIYSLTEQSNLWVKKVKKITSVLGYLFINSDPVNMIPLYQKSIQQRIHDIALQEQDSSMLNSSKLDFYKNIYKIQTRAQYVDSISYRSDRSVLAKIRISAHNLTVEKGRYTGILRHDRICKVCNTGSIENEQHFLLECPAYKLLCEDFILKLEKVAINGRTCHREPCSLHTTAFLYYPMNEKHKFPFFFLINRPFTHLFFEFALTQTKNVLFI